MKIKVSTLFFCLFINQGAPAQSFRSRAAQAIWKSADYGYLLYQDCGMNVTIQHSNVIVRLNVAELQCSGDRNRFDFSQSLKSYDFQINEAGEVFFDKNRVGIFQYGNFEATFKNEYEERIYLKFSVREEALTRFLVSVDSPDYVSYDMWSENFDRVSLVPYNN